MRRAQPSLSTRQSVRWCFPFALFDFIDRSCVTARYHKSCRTRSISSFTINFRRFYSAIFKSSVELCAIASAISCSSALCCRSRSARCTLIVIWFTASFHQTPKPAAHPIEEFRATKKLFLLTQSQIHHSSATKASAAPLALLSL